MASGGGGGSSRNDGGGSSCGGGGGSSCGGGDSAMALIESLMLAARHGSADGGGGGHGGGCGGGGEESRPADHSTHADALPSTRILRRWQHACWGLRGRLGVDRRVVRGGGSMATRSARVPTDQKGELKYTRTVQADSHVWYYGFLISSCTCRSRTLHHPCSMLPQSHIAARMCRPLPNPASRMCLPISRAPCAHADASPDLEPASPKFPPLPPNKLSSPPGGSVSSSTQFDQLAARSIALHGPCSSGGGRTSFHAARGGKGVRLGVTATAGVAAWPYASVSLQGSSGGAPVPSAEPAIVSVARVEDEIAR